MTGTGVVNHTTGVITVGNYTHSGAGADALGTGNITIGAQLQVSAGKVDAGRGHGGCAGGEQHSDRRGPYLKWGRTTSPSAWREGCR